MLQEVVERLGTVPVSLAGEWRALGDGAPLAKRLAFPLGGTSRGNVAASVRATFVAGMPGEVVSGRVSRRTGNSNPLGHAFLSGNDRCGSLQ